MIKNITFNSNGNTYTASMDDIFMDNGARIVFIKNGKHSDPAAPRIPISQKEWTRIMQQLKEIDYSEYFGRPPLLEGIKIYKVKR